MIRPYLRDMINNHKAPMELRVHSGNEVTDYETHFGEWKIQLTMQIIFISSIDSRETCIMRVKSDNIEIMMVSKTKDIIKELKEPLLQNYQEGSEESMGESRFIFDRADLLYYSREKTSLKRSGSYIKSPKWLKNKKAIINPKNDDDKCFQYSLIAALDHQKIGKNPQRISNIEPFIQSYEWKGIDFPSHSKDWKTFEQNNKTIALNILNVTCNTEEIRVAYMAITEGTWLLQNMAITEGKAV